MNVATLSEPVVDHPQRPPRYSLAFRSRWSCAARNQ